MMCEGDGIYIALAAIGIIGAYVIGRLHSNALHMPPRK